MSSLLFAPPPFLRLKRLISRCIKLLEGSASTSQSDEVAQYMVVRAATVLVAAIGIDTVSSEVTTSSSLAYNDSSCDRRRRLSIAALALLRSACGVVGANSATCLTSKDWNMLRHDI